MLCRTRARLSARCVVLDKHTSCWHQIMCPNYGCYTGRQAWHGAVVVPLLGASWHANTEASNSHSQQLIHKHWTMPKLNSSRAEPWAPYTLCCVYMPGKQIQATVACASKQHNMPAGLHMSPQEFGKTKIYIPKQEGLALLSKEVRPAGLALVKTVNQGAMQHSQLP
jgi:hypothetical protein